MITKVLFKQYLTLTPTFGTPFDAEVASADITEYLIEDEYSLDKKLEFDGIYNFIASSIDLKFIPNPTFTLFFEDSPISPFINNYFYGIEIYVNHSQIPEFWGYIIPSSVDKDLEDSTWSLTVADFLVRYKELWGQRNLPTLNNGATIGSSTLTDFFTEILSGTLINSVNVKIGDLSNFFALYIYNTYLVNDTEYFITQFIEEIQKHFGLFYFVDGTKTLNVVNRNVFLLDNSKEIDDVVISPVINFANLREYDGIMISDFYEANDPDQPSNSQGDGLYVLKNNGSGDVIVEAVMPYGGDDSEINLFLRKYPGGILDLSQRWNDYGVQGQTYVRWWVAVFVRDTFQQRFDSYKNILSYAKKIRCKVVGYDYELMERVKFQDDNYLVVAVSKNLLDGTADLELIEEI